ncbi:MAG: hypothetical protein LIP12_04985 [Clostridiales bacterium]|nr:hypothetical protein [Clostridiales bacterium]
MKKAWSVILAATMMAAAVAAPVSAEEGSAEVLTAGENLSADGLGGYKIGFFYYSTADAQSLQFHNVLDYCAELTNCEMEYYDMTAWDTEAISTAVETLVSNGCDGIIMILGSSPSLYEYMEENGVYYVLQTRSYTDEVALVVDGSEYNCGIVGDLGGTDGANYKGGYDSTLVLADEGCENIAIIANSEGETMSDEMVEGAEAAAADTGMNIAAEYRGSDIGTGASDILASYGTEIDGIVYCGSGDYVLAAIQSAGLSGQIALVQGECSDAAEYFEAGLLTATTAGASVYMVDLYMQVFNGLCGADRLFCEEDPRLVPLFSSFLVTSAEEYEAASIYTDGEVPGGILPDEILSFCSLTGGDMTIEEREALVETYQSTDYWNISDITARVGSYLGE